MRIANRCLPHSLACWVLLLTCWATVLVAAPESPLERHAAADGSERAPIQFRLVGESAIVSNPVPVVGASEDVAPLFQSLRHGRDFHYVLENLPRGRKLQLEFGFAELFDFQPGQRVFRVEVNGRLVRDHLDVAALAGGPRRALVLRYELESQPKLDIRFVGKRGDAFINYVRITGLEQEIVLGPGAGRLVQSEQYAPYDLDRGEIVVTNAVSAPPRAMPIGSIGTGSFELLPDGTFANFTIGNSWEKSVEPLKGTFLAVRAKHRSFAGEARLLRVGGRLASYANAPPMAASRYRAKFPFVEIEFSDPTFPLEVKVEAFAPYVPYDLQASSVPAACVTVEVFNPNNHPVASGVVLSWEDFIGQGGSGRPGDIFNQSPVVVHNDAGSAELVGVHLSSLETPAGRRGSFLGDQFVGTITTGVVATRILHWDPSTPTIPWWKEFIRSGRLARRPETPEYWSTSQMRAGASATAVAAAFNLAPKETKRIPFIISWYYPRFVEPGGTSLKAPAYAQRFASSVGAALYLLGNLEQMRNESQRWVQEILDSDLPDWLGNTLLNATARGVANSVWWQGEGVRWWASVDNGKAHLADDLHSLAAELWFERFFGAHAEPGVSSAPQQANQGMVDETLPAATATSDTLAMQALAARSLRIERLLTGQSHTGPLEEHVRRWQIACLKLLETASAGEARTPETLRTAGAAAIADCPALHWPWAAVAARSQAAIARLMRDSSLETAFTTLAQQFERSGFAQMEHSFSQAGLASPEAAQSLSAAFIADYVYRESCHSSFCNGLLTSFVQELVMRHLPGDAGNRSGRGEETSSCSWTRSLLTEAWLASQTIELGFPNAGLELAVRYAHELTQRGNNPWGPTEFFDPASGQTLGDFNHVAIVSSWSVLQAIVGVRYDRGTETLWVMPHLPFELGDHVFLPVFVAEFHGMLEYDQHEYEWKLNVRRVAPHQPTVPLRRIVTVDPDFSGARREVVLDPPLAMKAGSQLNYRAGRCEVSVEP